LPPDREGRRAAIQILRFVGQRLRGRARYRREATKFPFHCAMGPVEIAGRYLAVGLTVNGDPRRPNMAASARRLPRTAS
jgi:hypothetical protein